MRTPMILPDAFAGPAAGVVAAFREHEGWAAGGDRDLVMPQFEVIREMLSGLETLTAAGQRHSIGKILAFIRTRLRESGPLLSGRNRETVGELLDQLTRESARPWPDLRDVRERTESLIALLPSTGAPASTVARIRE